MKNHIPLRRSQRNEIFAIIKETKFSPTDFEFIENSNQSAVIEYKKEKSRYFYFKLINQADGKVDCTCSPGQKEWKDNYSAKDINHAIKIIKLWIDWLASETIVPDEWENLKEQVGKVNMNIPDSDEPFTPDEILKLSEAVKEIKKMINETSLSEFQKTELSKDLDESVEKANSEKFTKKDWKMLFIGLFLSNATRLAIDESTFHAIWSFTVEIFSSLPPLLN
ncbi:hypothetical protein [Aureispira sp. CCB-QB1]|uniref:hypothetical protein n=1 Tax=Aureispira sp. CCB-QB1 TaxID=1313421 RepID=UPI000698C5EE|nr:hypothetical protein [Aureispira sp. CCB-QB1]